MYIYMYMYRSVNTFKLYICVNKFKKDYQKYTWEDVRRVKFQQIPTVLEPGEARHLLGAEIAWN